MVWWVVPQWDEFFADGTNLHGAFHSGGVGGNANMVYTPDETGTGSPVLSKESLALDHFGGVSVARFDITTQGAGIRMLRSVADEGIDFGPTGSDAGELSIIAIFKPVGSGTIGSSDPRIYTKDEGSGAADHDLMIGSVSSQQARARIRINNSTFTHVVTTPIIQNDALNLIAGQVRRDVSGWRCGVNLVRADGGYGSNYLASAEAAGYTPRTTTDEAFADSAEATANNWRGDLLCICAFTKAWDDEGDLKDYFYNPAQAFLRRPFAFPRPTAAANPSASGASTLAPATAAGTAQVRKVSSGAATLAAATASGTAKRTPQASGAATLTPSTASGTGTRQATASGAATLTPATASGTAKRIAAASGGATLTPATASGTGTRKATASGGATLAAATASGSASTAGAKTASGAATLTAATAAGSAKVRKSATGAATLAVITSAGTSKRVAKASGGAITAPATATGTARRTPKASGGASITPATASGTGTRRAGASGAANLAAATSAGTAKRQVSASGSATLAVITAAGVSIVGGATVIDETTLEGRYIAVTLAGRDHSSETFVGRQIALNLLGKK